MKIRKRETFAPIHLMPQDTLTVYYTDETGAQKTLVTDHIQQTMVVDTALIVELGIPERGELGLDATAPALGGIIGKARA